MRTSREWRIYFEENADSLFEIPWEVGPELTAEEILDIGQSLREFQVGESSEGRHLSRNAQAYAAETGDLDYLTAIVLFIAEEQRHARDLAQFLVLNGIPLIRTTVADRVFRKLRNFMGGLENSIAVLVTAELIAKVYYAALRDATNSVILRRICEQILRDEAEHVAFQAGQLARMREGRSWLRRTVTTFAQRVLYFGTVLVVWHLHRSALRRGGFGFEKYWRACWQEFELAFSRRQRAAAVARSAVPRLVRNCPGTTGHSREDVGQLHALHDASPIPRA